MRTLHVRRRQRGATMIEAALTAVILFMLIFGIVGFGRAVWAFGSISHAAREATRWAAVRGSQSGRPASNADVTAYVRQDVIGLDRNNLTVTTSWINNNDPGSYVQVQVQYTVSQLVPWVPQMVLHSRSRMMIAQ